MIFTATSTMLTTRSESVRPLLTTLGEVVVAVLNSGRESIKSDWPLLLQSDRSIQSVQWSIQRVIFSRGTLSDDCMSILLLLSAVWHRLVSSKRESNQEERDGRDDGVSNDADIPDLHVAEWDADQAGKAQNGAEE